MSGLPKQPFKRAQQLAQSGDQAAAQSLRDRLQAATFDGELPEGAEADTAAAVALLEQSFPDMPEFDPFGASPGAGRRSREAAGGDSGGKASEDGKTGRRPSRTPKPGRGKGGGAGAGANAQHRRGRSRRRSAVDQLARTYTGASLARATGVPQAAWSTTQLLLYAAGGMVGLSILYLMLTATERAPVGRGPGELLTHYLQGGLARILSPVDPLDPQPAKLSELRADVTGVSRGISAGAQSILAGTAGRFAGAAAGGAAAAGRAAAPKPTTRSAGTRSIGAARAAIPSNVHP